MSESETQVCEYCRNEFDVTDRLRSLGVLPCCSVACHDKAFLKEDRRRHFESRITVASMPRAAYGRNDQIIIDPVEKLHEGMPEDLLFLRAAKFVRAFVLAPPLHQRFMQIYMRHPEYRHNPTTSFAPALKCKKSAVARLMGRMRKSLPGFDQLFPLDEAKSAGVKRAKQKETTTP